MNSEQRIVNNGNCSLFPVCYSLFFGVMTGSEKPLDFGEKNLELSPKSGLSAIREK